ALANAGVLELEVEFVPLYKGQPLFGDIQLFLREHNFVLHKLIDVGGRAFRPWVLNGNPYVAMSQLLWADAVFVRDFTKLEHWSDVQLLKAAVVLHEVYHSCDLVHRLLSEHDRRHSTGLAPRYAQHVLSLWGLPLLYMHPKS